MAYKSMILRVLFRTLLNYKSVLPESNAGGLTDRLQIGKLVEKNLRVRRVVLDQPPDREQLPNQNFVH